MAAHPPTFPISKKIIFAGKMGVGKSSLCNMLVQGDLYHSNICEVSDSAASVTPMNKVVDGRGWTAIDTPGLGDVHDSTPRTSAEIIANTKVLTRILNEGERGLHFIAYVVQRGRVQTEEQAQLFASFKTMFQGAEDNFVLIVTHCPSEKWAVTNRQVILDTFGTYPVVACNFPFDADDLTSG
ncbi:hypothetical protein BG006_005990 [Podila minutissima]|uniref:AIG1-type G domain-containing protein n=1 Tax=Podila minutissima TaxID=64525 RepID=A0A9P5VLN9_9FUNG|nr:hypothetical protein BG006_005990 [Podila minutissima]